MAYATIPDSNGIIQGCYANKDGALRVIDPATSQTCLNKETAVTWNQTGPQGPVGPRGPAGASRYLTVGIYHPADGTIDATIDTSASNTSATVTNPQPGVYCIGGLSPAPVSAVITAHDNINFSSSPPVPVNDDTIASASVVQPNSGDTLALCADTDQVRVTTYAAGNNGITGLVNRVFTMWLT
ncbi:MAG: hypothetical protein WAQ33_14445 [Gaiellaceae bacterium]